MFQTNIPAPVPASNARPRLALAPGLLAALVVGLVALLVGMPSLVDPFGRDQAEYATIADAAMQGQVIYRDVFNVKPPLTHLVHQVAIVLFGYSMLSIRLLDMFWQAATALVLLRIGRDFGKRWTTGALAATLYLVCYFSIGFWHRAQTDGFLTLPIALGVLVFARAERRRLHWGMIVSGLLIGLAVLFKYPIGLLGPLLALLLLVRYRLAGLGSAILLGLGMFIPLGLCGFWLAAHGGLDAFLWTQLTYIPAYSGIPLFGSSYLKGMFVGLGLFFLTIPLIGWIGLAGLSGAFVIKPVRSAQALPIVLLWWLAAVAHLAVQNKFYLYHALPLFAPQSLLLGMVIAEFISRQKSAPTHRLAARSMMALPLAGFLLVATSEQYRDLARVVTRRQPLAAAYNAARYDNIGTDTFSSRANLAAARYIAEHTISDDAVFVWGFEPSVYFLAQRPPATRFLYNFPLYGDYASPDLRAQFLDSIERSKPTYIVVAKNDAIPHVTNTTDDSYAAFLKFDAFHKLVAREYVEEIVIDHFTLFRRIADS